MLEGKAQMGRMSGGLNPSPHIFPPHSCVMTMWRVDQAVPRQSMVPTTILVVTGVLIGKEAACYSRNPDNLRHDMLLNLSFLTVITIVLCPVRGTCTS